MAVPRAIMNTLNRALNRVGVDPAKHPEYQAAAWNTIKRMVNPISGTTGLSITPQMGATCSYSGGQISCSQAEAIAVWNNAVQIGRNYRLTFAYNKGTTLDGSGIIVAGDGGFTKRYCQHDITSGNQTYSCTFTATGTTIALGARTNYFRGVIGSLTLSDLDAGNSDPNAQILCATSPVIAWLDILKCGNNPAPLDNMPMGAKGYSFDPDKLGQDAADCSKFKYRLDAEGNLIIPAMPTETGGASGVPQQQIGGVLLQGQRSGSGCVFTEKYQTGGCRPFDQFWATHGENRHGNTPAMARAVHRWAMHKMGQHIRDKRDYIGALRMRPTPNAGGGYCTYWATIAYRRDDNNEIVRRQVYQFCGEPSAYSVSVHNHRGCPDNFSGAGGDFHFYMQMGFEPGDVNLHPHECTWYAPRPDLTGTPDGYFINPETSVSLAELRDPAQRPEHIARCPIDPALIRKMTQIIWDGTREREPDKPEIPIQDTDYPPDDTRVIEVWDEPRIEEPTPPPPPGETTGTREPPPPAPPPPGSVVNIDPPSDGKWNLGCMFGLGGCGAPPPGTNEPSVPDESTDPAPISLDGLFNWLPKFDTLNTAAMQTSCPTWNLDLTGFGGPEWAWSVDSHCVLLASDTGGGTTVAQLVGTLFVALWGLTAALILLRA